MPCWRPKIQHCDMTSWYSWQRSEVHFPWHSAIKQSKPPINDSPLFTLDKGAMSHGSQDRWGNSLETKSMAMVCLAFQNLDGLSQTMEVTHFLSAMDQSEWDWHFSFVEHGTCWDLVAYEAHLPQKMRGWWESAQWSIGHNCLDKHVAVYQLGGTSIPTTNCLVHSTLKLGNNPLRMGQWCCTKLCGKQQQITRVVALYRACFSGSPLSTHQQQIHSLSKLQQSVYDKQPLPIFERGRPMAWGWWVSLVAMIFPTKTFTLVALASSLTRRTGRSLNFSTCFTRNGNV